MQMTLLDRMRERFAAAVAEIAAAVDAGAPPFVDLPGYDEAPDNRHVPGRRIPMAEAMAMITGAVEAMAAELASNLEICARALVAPDLLPSVLARESLAAEWPWLEGAWPRRLNTPKVEEWEAFGTLWKSIHPQDVKRWPGTVAPTDAAEWARAQLNEWAPGFGDRLVEHTQAGRPMWTIVVQAGPDRATAPPYGLGLLYRTQREVITEKPDAQPDAVQHLRALFALDGVGWIVLRTLDTKGAASRPLTFTDPAAAAAAAVQLDVAGGVDVYVAVARHIEKNTEAGSVDALTAAWCDLDPPAAIKGDADQIAVWRAGKLRQLEEFEPRPSMIVYSGRGLHCYWLLREPAAPARVRAVNVELVRLLDGDPAPVHAGAILRVAGTTNRKTDTFARIVWHVEERHYVDQLPGGGGSAVGPTVARSELLQRVADRAPGARWGTDPGGLPKVMVRAWCHPDANASAVVFANGRYWCSACHRSEAASAWTRRGEVKAWAIGALTEGRAARVRRDGVWAGPRKADATSKDLVTLGHATAVALRTGQVDLLAKLAIGVRFRDVDQVGAALLKTGGKYLNRVFWLNLLLLQKYGDAQAGYPFRLDIACALLGAQKGANGRYPGSVQRKISAAQAALAGGEITIDNGSGRGSATGAIVVRLARGKVGGKSADHYTLHRGIVAALAAPNGWFRWSESALRLDDEALGAYLVAQRRREQNHDGVDGWRVPLAELVEAAGGSWSTSEADHNPRRYLTRWQRRFEAAGPALGFVVEPDTGLAHVTPPRPLGTAPQQRLLTPQKG
ncbi:MAG: hypothetical protein ABJA82_06800 [Myxococcales bacterium]